MNSKLRSLLAVVAVLSMLMGGCGPTPEPTAEPPPPTEPQQPAATEAAPATEAPEPTQPPEPTATQEPPPTEVPEPTATEEAAAPEEPEQVVLHTTIEGQVADCLNPAFCWIPYNIWNVTYDTLVNWGAIGEPVEGRLAESWEISDDGTTWTFHLVDLEGATFHDGTPLTAEDVAWSLNYYGANEALTWLLGVQVGEYYGAVATDDRTVVLTLDDPITPDAFLNYLNYVYMLPRHIWEELDAETIYGFENAEVIGTGPFMMNEWVPGQYMILDANPNYWGGKPPMDRIVIQPFATPDGQILALTGGEVNHITDVPANFVSELEGIPEITVMERPPEYEYHMFFNMAEEGTRHPALADVAVRRAVAHAIDKDQLVEVVFEGRGVASNSMWDGGARFEWWAPPDVESYPFDLDEANRILDEAGYVDTDGDGVREMNDGSGEPLNFRFFFDAGQANHLPYAEAIATWLAEIGIAAKLESLESLTLTETALMRDFDMILYVYGYDWDPDYQLLALSCLGIELGANFPGYCNEAFDELYFAQRYTYVPEERREYVYELQRMVHDEVPWIQLVFINSYEAYNNELFDFGITDSQWQGWGWYGMQGIEAQ